MKRKKIFTKKRILLVVSVLVFGLFLLNLQNMPFSSSDEKENSRTIFFLGNGKLAPIIYEEKGETKGIAVDIAKGIGEKIGYNVIVEAIDWEKAQDMLLSGEADALMQMNPSPERERFYDFSDELLKSEFAIFIKTGSSISNVYDLKGKTVGIEKTGYPYYILLKYDGIKINIIPDWITGFNMIKSGELDAIVVDRWIGEYELAQSKVRGIQVAAEPVETHYSRIAVKKGNTELLNLINKGLKEINEDGTMANIISDWNGKNVIYFTEESLRNIVLYGIIIILICIILATLYWIHKVRKLNEKLEDEIIKRTKELDEANRLLQKSNAELERISMADGLTNISNRRHFDLFLHKMWKLSLREKTPLALIMVDIDNFKLYNDTNGHVKGDECLIKVANAIKDIIKRPGDLLARYGGEEFAILLYNTDVDGAAVIAEKIRANVENLAIWHKPLNSALTVSSGVAAMIPSENINPVNLIDTADRAMYKSKNNGGNTVTKGSLLLEDK